jgi:hypothetical protein
MGQVRHCNRHRSLCVVCRPKLILDRGCFATVTTAANEASSDNGLVAWLAWSYAVQYANETEAVCELPSSTLFKQHPLPAYLL